MLQPLHYSLLRTCTSHRGQSELPAPPETARHSSKRGSQSFAWPDHPRDSAVSGQFAGSLSASWTSPPGRASLVPLFGSGPLQCPAPTIWERKRRMNNFLKIIKVQEAKEVKGNSFLLASYGQLPDYQSSVLRGSGCLPFKSNLKASLREIVCK